MIGVFGSQSESPKYTTVVMDPNNVAEALTSLPQRPIAIITHKRSGTHLTMDVMRRQFEECDSWKWWGENHSRLYLSLQALYDPKSLTPISEEKAIRVLQRCQCPLVKTHDKPSDVPLGRTTTRGALGEHWLQWLNHSVRKLYVYRDGRDVMCSLRLLATKRDRSAWKPISQFIREEVENGMSRAAYWAWHVESGLSQPDFAPLKFESLVRDTRASLDYLAQRFNLTARHQDPLLPKKIHSVWQSRWSRLLERRPQSSAILGRPKEIKLDKWQEVFSPEDRAFFHREAGQVLLDLGYEESDSWVEGSSQE